MQSQKAVQIRRQFVVQCCISCHQAYPRTGPNSTENRGMQ